MGDLGPLSSGNDISLHFNLGGGLYINLWTGTATLSAEFLDDLGPTDLLTFDLGDGVNFLDYDHIVVTGICYQ